jgi:tRNA wybutosine-synthesizing protein 3
MLRSKPFLDAEYPHTPAEIVEAAKKRLGGFVTVRENGISYCFDVTRLMFSSGNVSEKARAAAGFVSYKGLPVLSKSDKLPLEGEVVIDLFCGLGYFTLPVLIHAGAKKVFACDWNPTATSCLRANLLANGVENDRCTIFEGDNRLMTLPERKLVNSADRVFLGLIPSSQNSWTTALKLLRPSGGWLHIHATKGDEEYEKWAFTELPEKLKELVRQPNQDDNENNFFEEAKKSWIFTTRHLERVKSYAPKVWHLVADVFVTCA